MSEIVALCERDFDRFIADKDRVAVVQFWAPWCGVCRTLAPILEALAASHVGSVKVGAVRVDEQRTIAQRFHIESLPVLLFFQAGAPAGQINGLPSPAAVRAKVGEILNRG